MKIAILCHSSSGGSGILATELALGLSQQGHQVHLIGERPPFRLGERVSESMYMNLRTAPPPLYVNLGEAPPPQTFWGQIFEIAKRSFAGRFSSRESAKASGNLHFHELLTFEYPLFDQSSFPTLRAANTLARLIDQYQIELVNAHYVIPHTTSAILARDSGIDCKIVTTLHGTDVTRVGQDPAFYFTTRHAINASDAVTAVCQFLVLEAQRSFSISRSISVIPNWVDSARFKRIEDPAIRARYAQPDERICVHISNFRAVKRSVDVVRVFARLLKKLPARLILVGEGPEKQACIDEAIALGVFGRVLSLGSIAEVESILGIADICLLPSEIEAFPLVLLEAMACGAVCIATNVGGVGELIEDRHTGLLLPMGDVDGMAEAAEGVLRDGTLSARIRRSALETVKELYSPERLIGRYTEVFNHALSGTRSSS